MNRRVIDDVRPAVVEAALYFQGTPFKMVSEYPPERSRQWLELGTNPDEGLDCSGLVIRSITRALRGLPTDWSHNARTAQDFADEVYGCDADLPLLSQSKVRSGDVIVWVESGIAVHHAAIAVEDGARGKVAVPYVHATESDTHGGRGGVRIDYLRENDWQWPVHIPLEDLLAAGISRTD